MSSSADSLSWSYDFSPRYLALPGRAGTMHYVDEGRGEPILLLHGNPTWSYLYRQMIPPLSRDRRVVAPDHLGFGRSDKPPLTSHTLERHIDNLGALIHALDLREITLVLHDWGGPIGLGCALEMTERIKRLVVLNTWAFRMPEETPLPDLLRSARQPGGEQLVLEQNLLIERGLSEGIHRQERLTAEVMRAYRAPFVDPDTRHGMLALAREIPIGPAHRAAPMMGSIEDRLAELQVPTVIIWGDRDPVFSPLLALRWLQVYPHASVFHLSEASHFLQEDEPDRIVEILMAFLDHA